MSIADNQISFTCYLKRGKLDANEEILYEPVHFIGYFSEYFPPSISHTPYFLILRIRTSLLFGDRYEMRFAATSPLHNEWMTISEAHASFHLTRSTHSSMWELSCRCLEEAGN